MTRVGANRVRTPSPENASALPAATGRARPHCRHRIAGPMTKQRQLSRKPRPDNVVIEAAIALEVERR